MTQSLIVYYSRTGTTRTLAGQIAAHLPPTDTQTCEEITEPAPRRGLLAYLKSGYQALFARPVPITASREDPAAFGLLLIGTPNWASHPSAPMRSWLTRHRKAIRDYAVFVTQGGSGAEHVIDRITQIVGHPPKASLVVNQDRIGDAGPQIDAFLAALGQGGTNTPAGRPDRT